MTLGAQTVVLVEKPGRDRFGDPLTGPDIETTVTGCMVQPDTTSEITDRRNTTTTSLRAWLPAGTVVSATTRVRYDGRLYSVDGDPDRWVDFEGVEDHVELRLQIVEG